LLIGPETKQPMHIGGQTDVQARTQFSLWSIFPAPLLISQNVLTWSRYALVTYSNVDLIAINQDRVDLGRASGPAVRLVGGDLVFPCVAPAPGPAASEAGGVLQHFDEALNCSNVWGRTLSSGDLAVVLVNNRNSTAAVLCDGSCMAQLNAVGRPFFLGYDFQMPLFLLLRCTRTCLLTPFEQVDSRHVIFP
jgi:hypothetical protein